MVGVAGQRQWMTGAGVLCIALIGIIASLSARTGVAGAASVAVTISSPAPGGSFHSGSAASVSVGSNALFVPHSRVVILECSDPGGSAAQLPTSISNCDENTVQADTVLVQPNGSLSEKGYTLYSLPNAVLGEQSNWQPVCDATHKCVLYVGENQNDFTQPKLFSQPFSIDPSASPAGSSVMNVPTSTGAPDPPSAAVSLPAPTLAFTGVAPQSIVLALLGLALVGLGGLSRRLVRKARR
jgi:hypothetical protein